MHCVVFQKSVMFIVAAVRTSTLAEWLNIIVCYEIVVLFGCKNASFLLHMLADYFRRQHQSSHNICKALLLVEGIVFAAV
jgi:hypothetical protein